VVRPESGPETSMNAIRRNDPCPCGSGKKYKKCCLQQDEARAVAAQPAPLPASDEEEFTTEILPEVDEAVDRLLARVEAGRLEGVEAGLEELLREHPDYYTTNYAMGTYLAMAKRDWERAIPFFETALETFPVMAEAHFNLGSCQMQVGHIAQAVDSLRQALRYAGDDKHITELAQENLQTLEKMVKETTPFKTLDGCVENQRLFDKAFDRLNAGDCRAAIGLFGQVLAQAPDHVQSHGNIALAYARLGQKARALEHLEKALALDPTYAPAIQNRQVIRQMTEGVPQVPSAIVETEYYHERVAAERMGEAEARANRRWWRRLLRLTDE
jgi:tetratricopeptide (TPR) repeat protein